MNRCAFFSLPDATLNKERAFPLSLSRKEGKQSSQLSSSAHLEHSFHLWKSSLKSTYLKHCSAGFSLTKERLVVPRENSSKALRLESKQCQRNCAGRSVILNQSRIAKRFARPKLIVTSGQNVLEQSLACDVLVCISFKN